jgi:catechol 1,2-dioxygenase
VDEITYVKAAEATDVATQSAILGPFFREDHPVRQKGDSISFDTPKDAEVSKLPWKELNPAADSSQKTVYMHGKVLDAVTKQPLPNVSIDVWQASTNGRSQSPGLNHLYAR